MREVRVEMGKQANKKEVKANCQSEKRRTTKAVKVQLMTDGSKGRAELKEITVYTSFQ